MSAAYEYQHAQSATGAQRIALRRLDPYLDRGLFWISYHWLTESPIWRQHAEAVFGTLNREEYMKARWAENRLDIGIFDNGAYVAKIAFHLTARNIYEVSLEASRTANPLVVATAGQLIRDQIFGLYGAEMVFAWVPRWARGVHAILTTIGFTQDSVTMLRGTSRGRLIEWLRFSIARTSDVEQEQTDHHPDAESGV